MRGREGGGELEAVLPAYRAPSHYVALLSGPKLTGYTNNDRKLKLSLKLLKRDVSPSFLAIVVCVRNNLNVKSRVR